MSLLGYLKSFIRQIDISATIAALCFFLCMLPYFVWENKFAVYAQVVFVLIAILNCHSKERKSGALIALACLYIYIIFRNNYSVYGNITILLFIPVLFIDDGYGKKVYSHFVGLYSFVILISLVVYVLITYFNINLSYNIIEPLNEIKENTSYYQYPLLVKAITGATDNFRFFGPFDEPGVVGNISAMILVCERFNLKKCYNWVVLISGIFSFSIFFYIVTIVYFIIYGSGNIKYTLMALLITICILPFFMKNEFFQLYIIDRYTSGQIDNRLHGNFEEWFSRFRYTTDYFWGLGGSSHLRINSGGASYKDIITDYGLVFFIFYVYGLFKAGLDKLCDKKMAILYLILVMSIIYQRPFITVFGYFLLLFMPQFGLLKTKEELENGNN